LVPAGDLRWLLSKQRESEAKRILRDAALLNSIDLPDFIIISDLHIDRGTREGTISDLVATHEARRITFPIWAIWGLFGFTYYGLVIFQGRIFSNQDEAASKESTVETCHFDYSSIFYNASSEFFAVLLSAALINHMGRIYSQSVCYIIGGVAVIVMGYGVSPGVLLFFSIVARMCAMSASVRILLCFCEAMCVFVIDFKR